MNASWFAQNIVGNVLGALVFTGVGYVLAKLGLLAKWFSALLRHPKFQQAFAALLRHPQVQQAMLALTQEGADDGPTH